MKYSHAAYVCTIDITCSLCLYNRYYILIQWTLHFQYLTVMSVLFIVVFIIHHCHTCILSMLLFLMPIFSFAALFFLFSSLFIFFIFLFFQLLLEILYICLDGVPCYGPCSTLFPYVHLYVIKIGAENSKFAVCISIVLVSVPNILSAPSLPQSVVSHKIFC